MSQYLSLNVVDAVLGTIGQLIHISTSLISTPFNTTNVQHCRISLAQFPIASLYLLIGFWGLLNVECLILKHLGSM